MFQFYTESARRVIFLARDEAMRYGSAYIESEHLLLAIFRENESLATRIAGPTGSTTKVRKEVEASTTIGKPVEAQSVEVLLSRDSKQVLMLAFEEAEALGHKQVCIGHLLLGILRVEKSTAAKILNLYGATITTIRDEARREMRWAG